MSHSTSAPPETPGAETSPENPGADAPSADASGADASGADAPGVKTPSADVAPESFGADASGAQAFGAENGELESPDLEIVDSKNPNAQSPNAERVSKLIARAGLASRRAAEDLISAGRVAVNGHFISEQGTKADPHLDKITLDGTPLKLEDKAALVVVLHKPKYTITTRDDPEKRATVFDLLPHAYANLHPVGRLDFETSGVLLLCDDGTLTHLLTHPSHGVEKVYEARVRGVVEKGAIEHLERGVKLEDGVTAPCRARVLAQREKNALVEISLREGRNRQVRRMLDEVGHPAASLRRVSFAGVELEGLLPGAHRELLPVEVKTLRRVAELGLKRKSRPRAKPKPHPRPEPIEAEEKSAPRAESKPHPRMSRTNNGRANSAREKAARAGETPSDGARREGADKGKAARAVETRQDGARRERAQPQDERRANPRSNNAPRDGARQNDPRPERERRQDANETRADEKSPLARRIARKWK